MLAAAIATMLSAPAHASEDADALRGHLQAISASAHTMAQDHSGTFKAMAIDAQHHTQELAPLVMGIEDTFTDGDSDIGERVLTQVLSLDAQLKAATETSGADWRAATDEIMRTTIVLSELSTALLHTAEPYRADPVALAD